MSEEVKEKIYKGFALDPIVVILLCISLFDLGTRTLVQQQYGLSDVGYIGIGVLLIFKLFFGTNIAAICMTTTSIVLGLTPVGLLIRWGFKSWRKSKDKPV